MDKESQIKLCRRCNNHKNDELLGIICKKANEKPVFSEKDCSLFDLNEDFDKKEKEIENNKELIISRMASKNKRLINFLIDITIIYSLQVFINLNLTTTDKIFDLTLSFTNILIFFLYYTIFESLLGKTPGKFITKTKVVDEIGNKVNIQKILFRTFVRGIIIDPFTYLGSDIKNGLHDKMVKTRVIDEKISA